MLGIFGIANVIVKVAGKHCHNVHSSANCHMHRTVGHIMSMGCCCTCCKGYRSVLGFAYARIVGQIICVSKQTKKSRV